MNYISSLLPHAQIDGDIIQAILMLVTNDHIAQYKLYKLKQSQRSQPMDVVRCILHW